MRVVNRTVLQHTTGKNSTQDMQQENAVSVEQVKRCPKYADIHLDKDFFFPLCICHFIIIIAKCIVSSREIDRGATLIIKMQGNMTMIHNPETPSKFHLSLLMTYLAACVGKLFGL